MSYDFLFYAFSFLLGSWLVLAVRTIQFRRKINVLEASLRLKELDPHNKFAAALSRLGKTALSTGEVLATFPSVEPDDYADKDKDGVPDAFQRRRPLNEILEFEKDSRGHANDYWVAIELPARYPRDGEYFLLGNKLCQTLGGDWHSKAIVVKSVPGTNLDDLVDLT